MVSHMSLHVFVVRHTQSFFLIRLRHLASTIQPLFFVQLPGFFYKLPFSTGGQWHCGDSQVDWAAPWAGQ